MRALRTAPSYPVGARSYTSTPWTVTRASAGSKEYPAVPARAPMEASIRPQFGSAPKMAALTRLEPAQALARSSATSSAGAPSTETSSSLVAPSPSAAISLAICWQSSSSAPEKASSADPGSAMGVFPALPVASAKTQSLVDMSPSTVSALKLRRMAWRSATESIGGVIAQSVATTAIIVASEGAIIPEPLQMQVRVTSLFPMRTDRAPNLMRVSVVRIASAAGRGSAFSEAASAGTAATILWAGSRTPIAPVEALTTAPAPTWSSLATASQTVFTSSSPSGPVSALALPLLITTARIPSAGSRFSASRTGAALARFWVKQPAAEQGVSLYTSARSLRFGLMPDCMPAQKNPLGTFTDGTPAAYRGRWSLPSP